MNFEEMEKEDTKRQFELYISSIHLNAGYFSDVGYRFRPNYFYKSDYWWPFGEDKIETFFDWIFYN